MVICRKNQAHCRPSDDRMGDAWIGLSLDRESRLILSGWVGKPTDNFLKELIWHTEGKLQLIPHFSNSQPIVQEEATLLVHGSVTSL